MKVRHGCGRQHDVTLLDDGTLDTVVEVDGTEIRFSEADRREDGSVETRWLREAAIEACQDGLLEEMSEED